MSDPSPQASCSCLESCEAHSLSCGPSKDDFHPQIGHEFPFPMMLSVQDVPTAVSVPRLWWTLLDQDSVSQPVGCDPHWRKHVRYLHLDS